MEQIKGVAKQGIIKETQQSYEKIFSFINK